MIDFNMASEMLTEIVKSLKEKNQINIDETFSDEYIRNLSEVLTTYCSLILIEKKYCF